MEKLFIFILAMTVSSVSFSQKSNSFGKEINDKKAIEAKVLPKKMAGKEELATKVTGTVESVCQVKGCWMKVKMDNGETMRVMFRDYAFFVPKDIAGRTVVFEGDAQLKTVPIEHLQHYEKDAGKSDEEIAKITEPKKEMTFIADGVLVK